VVYGPLINDPFAKARATGLMLGYFFSEDLGVEFSYLNYDSSQNDTVTAYETQFGGAKPDYNLIRSSKTISVVYSPFYAKMALMNKSIMYFDMGLTLGLGLSDYEIQKVNKDGSGNKSPANEMASSPHIEIGVMQQLFINQNIALRLDIKNTFYKQDTKQYEIGIGAPESSRGSGSKSSNDTTITVGFTYFK
jgi:outer membrane beta-barrel protein